MTDPTTPPPGWYDDGTGQQRYWNGTQWAEASTVTGSTTAVLQDAAPAPAAQAQATPRKQRNVLGLVAFIVAVVGFIFACIPGALIIGWVLSPIAFILAIVALFFKGQGKAFALTGLILSVVGTIVAFVVFFAVVANSFNDAFGGTGSNVTQTNTPKSTSAANDAASSKVGTRKNPAAVGATITGKDFTVTINSVNLNANDAIAGANEFNDPPKDGSVYALVNATVKYTGAKSGLAAEAQISYVTAGGNVINSFDNLVVAPDPTLGADELYTGASTTGNIAFEIPKAADGLIRVAPGILADDVFVKTS